MTGGKRSMGGRGVITATRVTKRTSLNYKLELTWQILQEVRDVDEHIESAAEGDQAEEIEQTDSSADGPVQNKICNMSSFPNLFLQ